jgi:hypothetical protein
MFENADFKAAFINRMAALLQMNFESSRVLARIKNMMAEIESEIPRDQKRWKLNASRMENQLKSIKDFAQKRPEVLYQELREYFELGESAPLTLAVQGSGTILVHGLPLDRSTMTIPFFENFPVTLTASPSAGGVWKGWSDGVKEASRTVVPGEISELKAIFK